MGFNLGFKGLIDSFYDNVNAHKNCHFSYFDVNLLALF